MSSSTLPNWQKPYPPNMQSYDCEPGTCCPYLSQCFLLLKLCSSSNLRGPMDLAGQVDSWIKEDGLMTRSHPEKGFFSCHNHLTPLLSAYRLAVPEYHPRSANLNYSQGHVSPAPAGQLCLQCSWKARTCGESRGTERGLPIGNPLVLVQHSKKISIFIMPNAQSALRQL